MTTSFDLRDQYVVITDTELERHAGAGFWERLATDQAFGDRVGAGWLIAAFAAETDWVIWEMHPAADEVVHATAGRFVVRFRCGGDAADGALRSVPLEAGSTVIVPAGTWHTVDVVEPGAMLSITHGSGTEHRPR